MRLSMYVCRCKYMIASVNVFGCVGECACLFLVRECGHECA